MQPFVGAGVNHGILPWGIPGEWTTEEKFRPVRFGRSRQRGTIRGGRSAIACGPRMPSPERLRSKRTIRIARTERFYDAPERDEREVRVACGGSKAYVTSESEDKNEIRFRRKRPRVAWEGLPVQIGGEVIRIAIARR